MWTRTVEHLTSVMSGYKEAGVRTLTKASDNKFVSDLLQLSPEPHWSKY